jgi:ABC-2 type transport system permease protein
MSRRNAFGQLILARIREFYREPETIFWVYGFPLVLAIVLGLAFSGGQPEPPTVDVEGLSGDKYAEAIVATLQEAKFKVSLESAADSIKRFKNGKTDLVIVPRHKALEYRFDPTRKESLLARNWADAILMRGKLGEAAPAVTDTIEEEPGNRYIDFLLPGLIGMNIMGGGLFGVGFVLVDMRVRKLFKRLMATPVHRGDFLFSLISARMLFLMPEMLTLLLVGCLPFGPFGVPLKGALLTLALVIVLGAFAFAGIGLVLGCRTEKTESISGLINLVMMPMYLLSGVFFSSKRFPDEMQPFIQALPLTQLNEALREIMLHGASLTDIAVHLGILLAWGLVTFALALRWFRWN